MLENQDALLSTGRKRLILIADDEMINREMLAEQLKADYDILLAENGAIALELIQQHQEKLSLILLDLRMPVMTGQELLSMLQDTPELRHIPVIVLTSDHKAEVECLRLGAIDFIPKPYPDHDVIMARILRTIELFEDRQTIQYTERDPLTGLYNREYFYRYTEQFDRHHPDTPMDALVMDVNHFHLINERYGKAFGDQVLRDIADQLRSLFQGTNSMVCRQESDTFLVYCPHRENGEDYRKILDAASLTLTEHENTSSIVRLRMGVYPDVDKTLDPERRFDRAKNASDTIRGSFTKSIGIYDNELHKEELFHERLIDDFRTAIEEHQFLIYYQPKFNVCGKRPILSSAEALVRWQHPELGMISPGVFIPLFENNGLIQELDAYVWRTAAAQQREWIDRLGTCVPVSVNVSRVDMYDANIVYTLLDIIEESKLEPCDLHLEVTESAYAEDAEQIIETVKRLRSMSFLVEMDDFGTGYSSLNMLSTLPIDVLKLDMKFISTAFSEETDTHMLEIIIEIARHISAPVVAEGVETEEQMTALKKIGCDMVQGYYFSPPVPAEKFAGFLKDAKQELASKEAAQPKQSRSKNAVSGEKRRSPLKRWSDKLSIPMKKASYIFVLIAFIVATGLYVSDSMVTHGYLRMEQASERYIIAQQSATNLEIGSDTLTEAVRSFVVTGEFEYLQNYFTEANEIRTRDKAVASLETMMTRDSAAYGHLSEALRLSNELMEDEYRAMKLILSGGEYDEALVPDVLRELELRPEDAARSPEEKRALALELVYGDRYKDCKADIRSNAELCTQELIEASQMERVRLNERMNVLLSVQTILTIALLAVVLVIVIFISGWIRKPLSRMVEQMKAKETVPPTGAEELRFVSETYNAIFEENRRTHERLTYGNMHDALTGLFNRSAYDFMRHDLDMSRNALLLVDVDKFKGINDTYGHDVGDLVLKRVAEALTYSFRSTDLIFRLGGDEFVVIMANVDSSMREQVIRKIDQANVMLQKPKDDLPPTSLSVGAAFGDRENPEGDIFKDADTALYRVKEAGRCGCYIY